MSGHLIDREVLPFFLALLALAAAALLLDAALHLANAVWIGRYLGIAGTLLILVSLRYSLRKRKIITTGTPAQLLRQHEWLPCAAAWRLGGSLHQLPCRGGYTAPLATACTPIACVLPPRFTGGITGPISVCSSSVRSLG